MLLAFCSAHHPCRFDMPHDNVCKKFFDPLGTSSAPKSDPGSRIKIPSDMFCIFHLREQTLSLV